MSQSRDSIWAKLDGLGLDGAYDYIHEYHGLNLIYADQWIRAKERDLAAADAAKRDAIEAERLSLARSQTESASRAATAAERASAAAERASAAAERQSRFARRANINAWIAMAIAISVAIVENIDTIKNLLKMLAN